VGLVKNSRDGRARQLRLFQAESEPASPLDNGSLGFSDPAFASNKALPVHRWVPWIAGFSSGFVRTALKSYLAGPGSVLDPFAGVGTTLVEAILFGHQAIGFEINPYAAFACRVKVTACEVPVDRVYGEASRFQAFYDDRVPSGYVPKRVPPAGFKTGAPFYSPEVLRKVLTVLDFIDTVEDPAPQGLFRLAFASTMVRYSNYSYGPSLGRRASAGKEEIRDFPVGQVILSKLMEMAEDIAWLQANLPEREVNARVINDSFFQYPSCVVPGSVDLIVTSPPYLNNYHYNRNTRPHLYWLGYAERPQDLARLEQVNFGKFWQTVRDKAQMDLTFSLPGTDIEDRLQEVRALHPEKGAYGGHGWANYAVAYFNDCYRFARGIHHVLRGGGTALMVIGNSILQGILIPTDQYFGRIAESVGLELVRIDIPRATRVGNSIIQSDVRVAKAQEAHQLYEAVVELKKS